MKDQWLDREENQLIRTVIEFLVALFCIPTIVLVGLLLMP